MPIFQLTSPEGQTYRITAPDGATEEDAFNQLQQHLGTGSPTTAPEEPSALKSVVRKAVEYLAPNVAAQYPVGTKQPFDRLPPTLAGIRDLIKGAQPLAMDFTKGEASTEQVPQLMETAALGLTAPAGSVLGRTAGAARGARPPATPGAPTATEAKSAAQEIYQPIDRMAAATPLPERAGAGVADRIEARLAEINKDRSTSPETFAQIDAVRNAQHAGNLVNVRRALGGIGGDEIVPARLARSHVEQAIDQHLPIDQPAGRLAAADQNWNSYRVAEGLDKNINKAELQTAGANSGTNLGNKLRQMATQIATNERRTRYMRPEEVQRLVDLSEGTGGQNFSRAAGNMLGAGHGVQGGMWGMAAALTGHPELLTPIVAGKLLRSGYNRSVANQAGQLSRQVLERSPMHRARVAAHEQALARWQAANPSSARSLADMAVAAGPLAAYGSQR